MAYVVQPSVSVLPSDKNETENDHELYQIIKDPYETTNLASENPEKVEHLKAEMCEFMERITANKTSCLR